MQHLLSMCACCPRARCGTWSQVRPLLNDKPFLASWSSVLQVLPHRIGPWSPAVHFELSAHWRIHLEHTGTGCKMSSLHSFKATSHTKPKTPCCIHVYDLIKVFFLINKKQNKTRCLDPLRMNTEGSVPHLEERVRLTDHNHYFTSYWK